MNPQENAELLAALMRQEELLKQLVAAINKPKLSILRRCRYYPTSTVFVSTSAKSKKKSQLSTKPKQTHDSLL
ncbi:hypothetical protein [Nostoc sp. CCY 9925]|uniref:hypothetical protein n=1 Tax=Nostoc sp. CCY 9925 TaxID=3103865 RepID=UPI0039C6EBF1